MTHMYGLHTVRDLLVVVRTLNRLAAAHAAARRGRANPTPQRAGSNFRCLLDALYGPGTNVIMPGILNAAFQQWSPGDELDDLVTTVTAMYQVVPRPWFQAILNSLPRATQPQDFLGLSAGCPLTVAPAVSLVIQQLGWATPTATVALAGTSTCGLTVRRATILQLGGALAEQRQARSMFVACALAADAAIEPPLAVVEASRCQLEVSMRQLWRLHWDNARREAFWRLSVNGVPGAGGHGICPPSMASCICGWHAPEPCVSEHARALALRTHCFWLCPVATAVVATIASALPPGARHLQCADVWLLRPPAGSGVDQRVWALVSMVAVEAMQVGRKAMWSMHAKESSPEVTQTLITDYFPVLSVGGVAPLSLIARASRFAVARFWSLLQDFALVGQAPWSGDLDASHPFFCVRDGQFTLQLPIELTLPPSID